MSKPVAAEEVCNLSLDLLRHNIRITSLETPENDEEAIGARWYDATRRSTLRMFPWNFARKRDSIPRDSVTPAFGYSDAYVLPNDYVAPVFVGEDPVTDFIDDFVVEGNLLLCNNDGAASLHICYIYDVIDVARFDSIFLMLLVGELAVVFGNSITGLNKSIKGMELFRDRWEVKARSKNGQENPPRIRHSSPLLNSRRSGRRATSSDGVHLFS
jgi:hypothetical protein